MIKKSLFAAVFFVFAAIFLYAQTQDTYALSLYNSEKYKQTISQCKAELEKNPNNLDIYTILCWSLLKNGQYKEAEYWATEALKISQYDHRIIEILAEAKYFLGNNDAALAFFQQYISLVRMNASRIGDAYYYMGEIYIRKAMFNHADISLSVAVRFSPRNDNWLTRLGYAREMAKNYREAALAYTKALEINPTHQDAARGKERISKYIY